MSVKIPFPSDLLDKMVALERMLREHGGILLRSAAEQVKMMQTLMRGQGLKIIV